MSILKINNIATDFIKKLNKINKDRFRKMKGITTGFRLPPTTNLVLWLDASKESYSNNDNVTIWHDQSGNGYDFTPPFASPTFLTNQVNGFPCVSFDTGGGGEETGESLRNTTFGAIGNSNDVSVFAVVKPRVGLSNKYLLTLFEDGAEPSLGFTTHTRSPNYLKINLEGGVSSVGFSSTPLAYVLNTWCVVGMAIKDDESSAKGWLNNLSEVNGTVPAYSHTTLNYGVVGGIKIFGGNYASNDIDIAELLVYQAYEPDGIGEAAGGIVDYLNAKYSIF